jgi:hypothetical protein
MSKVFPFSSLQTAELVIDAVYEGGTKGNTADDVLGKLILGAGNQGDCSNLAINPRFCRVTG